jgi:hypothetical protein
MVFVHSLFTYYGAVINENTDAFAPRKNHTENHKTRRRQRDKL